MSQSTLEPPIESLLSRLFRHIVPSLLTPLSPQSKFNYWRMPSDLYFKVYSTLAKSTRSAYEYVAHNSFEVLENLNKSSSFF